MEFVALPLDGGSNQKVEPSWHQTYKRWVGSINDLKFIDFLSVPLLTTSILCQVEVPIVSDDQCRLSYPDDMVGDSMICAGEAGKDSCQGDSGGPLTCQSTLSPKDFDKGFR